ncbi:LexA/Signal peptidase [Aureobasidium pullulans]|uniref:Mitochondrial inner membrane protease subunit n=1 Tax=Aureobasidium pullulans TaxID=5580 RepID=A0A4S9TPU4_AURPU|nr:LexA/Signal peptidase [Aureobasidium pullulans]
MFTRLTRLFNKIPAEARLCGKGAFIGCSTWIVLNDHVLEPITVEGVSMSPTLSPSYHETGAKDTLLMNKWSPLKNLQRGDVVMLDLPHKPEKLGIKRVVALEGDWVTLDYRRRDRGGKEGSTAEGMVWEGVGEKKEFGVGKRRWKVPYGHVWVEGDNVNQSKDSNSYGPISKSLIVGKAIVQLRPFSKLGEKPWEGYNIKTKVEKDPNFEREGWEDLFY